MTVPGPCGEKFWPSSTFNDWQSLKVDVSTFGMDRILS